MGSPRARPRLGALGVAGVLRAAAGRGGHGRGVRRPRLVMNPATQSDAAHEGAGATGQGTLRRGCRSPRCCTRSRGSARFTPRGSRPRWSSDRATPRTWGHTCRRRRRSCSGTLRPWGSSHAWLSGSQRDRVDFISLKNGANRVAGSLSSLY
jgi:hypothetical protein